MPRAYRTPTDDVAIVAESLGNPIRELADRLADEAARAAEYRVRLELTEQAASTVQAELEAERRQREEAERERDELPRPPPVGPQRGSVRRALWRRVFGG